METCATLPPGLRHVPRVGQCVSLFATFQDLNIDHWTKDSVELEVPDSDCAPGQAASS